MKFNLNLLLPEGISLRWRDSSPAFEQFREVIGHTIFDCERVEEIYLQIVPKYILDIVKAAEKWGDIEVQVLAVFERDELRSALINSKRLLGIPCELLQLLAYSINLDDPELIQIMLRDLVNADP